MKLAEINLGTVGMAPPAIPKEIKAAIKVAKQVGKADSDNAADAADAAKAAADAAKAAEMSAAFEEAAAYQIADQQQHDGEQEHEQSDGAQKGVRR